jgi:hypothetical protein
VYVVSLEISQLFMALLFYSIDARLPPVAQTTPRSATDVTVAQSYIRHLTQQGYRKSLGTTRMLACVVCINAQSKLKLTASQEHCSLGERAVHDAV